MDEAVGDNESEEGMSEGIRIKVRALRRYLPSVKTVQGQPVEGIDYFVDGKNYAAFAVAHRACGVKAKKGKASK